MSKKSKFPLYMDDRLRDQIDRYYTADGCASRTEFIEKAVREHLSRLIIGEENPLLPTAVSSAIEGRLGVFEERISKLLFKQSVELAMVEAILAEELDLDEERLEMLRQWCNESVKRTNGRLSFKAIAAATEEAQHV